MSIEKSLKALGRNTIYHYSGARRELLERFTSPMTEGGGIHIEAAEFTSLCPITGQPDFATIVIDYTPDNWCVESKSLKLYLGSFRQQGMFHEACVHEIASALNALLQPKIISVWGQFSPRGGIKFWPTVTLAK